MATATGVVTGPTQAAASNNTTGIIAIPTQLRRIQHSRFQTTHATLRYPTLQFRGFPANLAIVERPPAPFHGLAHFSIVVVVPGKGRKGLKSN
jgi:hypothetical protein